MKRSDILFLAHRIPYPPDRGDKIRSWNLLKYLSRFGIVHLACFADDETDLAHRPALREALEGRLGQAHVELRSHAKALPSAKALLRHSPLSLALFDSPNLRGFVEQMLASGSIGTVFGFSGQMAQFVPKGVKQRFIMDLGDVDSAKFAQYSRNGKGPMRWVYGREADLLFRFERATAERADVTTFVSEAEAALFRAQTGLSTIKAVSNGIDLNFFDPEAGFERLPAEITGEGPILLFTGQMDYAPNVDAVCWFAKQVLPLIDRARFVIAGRNPAAEVSKLANGRVIVTGAVEDIRSWIDCADLIVAPLRIARGIQNKVLEAMAMAKPVVATRAAFEGIEATAGQDLIVADSPKVMAREIAALLSSSARAKAIGEAGRRRMMEAYSWEQRLAVLDEILFPRQQMEAA